MAILNLGDRSMYCPTKDGSRGGRADGDLALV